MQIPLTIILFLLAGFLYLRHKIHKNYDKFMEENSEDIAKYQEEFEVERAQRQSVLQQLVVYRTLRDSINEGMSLSEMIDAFQKMCTVSVGDPDDLLFETGTYNFTGEKTFIFSLVRQFQFLDSDEYVQLHLNVHYAPSATTAPLYRTKWGKPEDADFFDKIKTSPAFKLVHLQPIIKVEIYVDET